MVGVQPASCNGQGRLRGAETPVDGSNRSEKHRVSARFLWTVNVCLRACDHDRLSRCLSATRKDCPQTPTAAAVPAGSSAVRKRRDLRLCTIKLAKLYSNVFVVVVFNYTLYFEIIVDFHAVARKHTEAQRPLSVSPQHGGTSRPRTPIR